MPENSKDPLEKLSLSILGLVCLITVFMCQTRFKIAKEIKPEVTPPLLKSNYVSMIYGFGRPERFRLVLRALIINSVPVLSVLTTSMLLLGKKQCNPYLCLPWLFITLRDLCLVQTNNLYAILKEMYQRYDRNYDFSLQDLKWSCLYFTIFFLVLAECFAFYEVLEIFRQIWYNRNQKVVGNVAEGIVIDTSEIEKNMSDTDISDINMNNMNIAASAGNIEEYHTITSICKFSLFSGKRSERDLPILKSLIALFRKN